MANVLSLKHLKNKVSRNGFDLSENRTFTAKVGEILPCFVLETLPGDNVNINPSHFTRTMPVNTAAFSRIKEYVHYYFVPYKLLHADCPQFFSDNKENSFKASDINGGKRLSDNLPYITHKDLIFYLKHLKDVKRTNALGISSFYTTCKLLEYLGYGRFDAESVETMYSYYQDGADKHFNLNFRLNPFVLLAYQKVYQDHFRNQQWERSNPSSCNIDYMKFDTALPLSELHKPVETAQNDLFTLRYCDYAKDYFFGLLPNAQYGDTATFPVNGSQELIKALTSNRPLHPVAPYPSGSGGFAPDPEISGVPKPDKQTWNPSDSVGTRSAGGTHENDDNNLFKPAIITDSEGGSGGFVGGYLPDPHNPFNPPSPDSGYTPNPENPFQNISLSASVLALRKAEALQKYREIKQTGKQDYKDYLEKIFNVTISDSASDLSIYLGGYNSQVDINEVVNTALTDGAVADIKGKGYSQGGTGTISFEAKDFGVIIGIYTARPVLEYAIDAPIRANTRVSLDDYANPVFDKIGMETLRLNEVISPSNLLIHDRGGYVQGLVLDDLGAGNPYGITFDAYRPIGYCPRYTSYKTNYDKVLGEFRNTLSAWVSPMSSSKIIKKMYVNEVKAGGNDNKNFYLTYNTFKVHPAVLDPIFVQHVDDTTVTDQLLVKMSNNCPIVRNLDYDGLPY